MINLTKLVQQARDDGWASAKGRIDTVRFQASRLKWELIPSRKGGPDMDILTPKSSEEASKQSLSAKFGLGAQPLHTDGAHHLDPPDIILLSTENTSDVYTMLWRFAIQTDAVTWHDLRHGLFTVRSGNETFLAPAFDADRVRFDPGCMAPADARSNRVMDFFASVEDEAIKYEWTEPDTVLAIDNRRVLHARGAAEAEPARSMYRVAIRIPEETR